MHPNHATKSNHSRSAMLSPSEIEAGEYPVLVCLLGHVVLLKETQPISLRSGSRTEALLYTLGLNFGSGVPRDALLQMLWPDSDSALAKHSLHSLIYSLHKLLGDGLAGATPVLFADGRYRFNAEAGISVDVQCFDALADSGDQQVLVNNPRLASDYYIRAASLYHGDLAFGTDVHAVIERERLRAHYLTILARLSDYYFDEAAYTRCLTYAHRLLAHDACREDAHRQVMRCNVRMGERAQALRQYRLCESILLAEFGARPEAATTALYDQARLTPASV